MTRTLFLVVDDMLEVRRTFSVWLKQYGYEVVEAETVHQGAQAVQDIPELFMLSTDLQVGTGTARGLHRMVGKTIQERHGLFMVTTGSSFDDPSLAPYGEYFRDHQIPVFCKPILFRTEFMPFVDGFRDRRVG